MTTYTTPGGQYSKLYRDALSAPHLMIAGATGSGKSVIVNALIYTALCYSFPSDSEKGARFILIDPKRVELARWRELPHVIRYASEPQEMLSALQYAMAITESRYQEMRRKGIYKHDGGDVYVIIDEFADLMTTQGKTVKPLVQRLAQIGRAAKVHIILCTQCPLAKVIPTEIKVNFDYRFALRTATRQHSRNIMDAPGCELLPRYGQGYFVTPEGTTLRQIKMYSDEEIAERVNFWMEQKKANEPKSWIKRLFCK